MRMKIFDSDNRKVAKITNEDKKTNKQDKKVFSVKNEVKDFFCHLAQFHHKKETSSDLLVPRVEFFVNFSQTNIRDMGINLSSRDVFVAKHLLDTAQISSLRE